MKFPVLPTIEEEIVEERSEGTIEETPYPRRGKTRLQSRLVHPQVLFDLGYPYYYEEVGALARKEKH